jgi:pimeloyl-ACP methyl ester carboxylesterase
VLLHGVGLDHTVWDRVRADLVERGCTVHAPDLPGHGSAPRVSEDADLAEMAALLDRDVPVGAHLVGFSLGALVAQHLAAQRLREHGRPGVATLTSVASVCRRTPDEAAAVLARLETARADPEASTAASLARWFDGTDVPAADVEHTRAVLTGQDHEQFLRCYRVFATGDQAVAPLLSSIDVPALAITGADDPGSTPEMTQRLAAALPECRAEVLPGVRHMLPLQAPAALTQHIAQLIGRTVHV